MEVPDSKRDQPLTRTPLPGMGSDPDSATLKITSKSVFQNLEGVLESAPAVQLRPDAGEAPQLPMPAERTNKYQTDSMIGSGGMGTVYKVFDADLRRWVAMKVIRQDAARSKEHLSRFIEEAQVCGQLEHPHIPPVHEMGVDPNGQVYFTMKLVKGRTLQEIARDLSLGRPEVRREFTPIRIAQVLQQAAMGVHYANVRGVIHRDIKPDNIMVGDYGEVLVMDWGLAKVAGEDSGAHLYGEDAVMTARTESGLHTIAGAVQGTPSYMSPEQARGDVGIDARTDVYGLGGALYTLLCFQPPHRGRTVEEVLQTARTGTPLKPSQLAPKRTEIPPDLEAVCMKALSPNREERHADARDFQKDLQSFIEGTHDRERRRKHAMLLVSEGRKQITSFRENQKRHQDIKADVRRLEQESLPYDPVEKKRQLWGMIDSIEKLEQESLKSFSQARAALDGAIQTDPGCQEARRALADLYYERFVEAEYRRDASTAALYRGLVEAHDDGRYAARLKGDGTLSLESDPPGAEATIYRYVEQDRVLVPSQPASLGRTPVGPITLPMGTYLVVLKREGHPDVRYPVYMPRAGSHVGRVRLFTEAEIGADFVYVPSGEFIRGGAPEGFGGYERSAVHVDGYYIARFPVTMGEYCEFLDALAAKGEDIKQRLPHQIDEVYVEQGPGGHYRPTEIMVVGETRKRYPPGFEKGCPALAISWHSAMAYARWRSERDGRNYTLPPEDAWEKAARGVDGRSYPWGDHFDWTFTKGGCSRPERAQPEPVGTFPIDESPYGVRDVAGTIREWTDSWYDERAGTRVCRGGAWSLMGPWHFYCANRMGITPHGRSSTIGFRLFTWSPR